jgi:hypothetical protein
LDYFKDFLDAKLSDGTLEGCFAMFAVNCEKAT